ncbi:MAG: T9SS type A sorting domain-containing protein [Chitinophagaceae bacterium]
MKEFKLERDIVSCLPVVVVSYPPFTCSSIAGTFSRVSDCSLVYTKKAMEELPVLNQKETITAGIYPNPVQRGGTVTINVKVVRTEVVQIKIFSLDGKLVQSKSYTLIKGDNRIPVVADSRWG